MRPSKLKFGGLFCLDDKDLYIFAYNLNAMDTPQLKMFADIELELLHNRSRHRTSAQECDGNIVSRTDRVNARNRVLTARYYYWTELQRRRFDDVLRILADREFFIEERTITNALLAQDDFLRQLCIEKTTRKQLRKMFPGFDWS